MLFQDTSRGSRENGPDVSMLRTDRVCAPRRAKNPVAILEGVFNVMGRKDHREGSIAGAPEKRSFKIKLA